MLAVVMGLQELQRLLLQLLVGSRCMGRQSMALAWRRGRCQVGTVAAVGEGGVQRLQDCKSPEGARTACLGFHHLQILQHMGIVGAGGPPTAEVAVISNAERRGGASSGDGRATLGG